MNMLITEAFKFNMIIYLVFYYHVDFVVQLDMYLYFYLNKCKIIFKQL